MKCKFVLLIIIILSGCAKRVPPLITGFEGKPLPTFNLLEMDSTTRINTANIPSGKPVVLFLFSPYCPYCRAQTEDIIKNIKELKNIQVYLVSEFPFTTLKNYYDQYQLSSYPDIKLMQDYENYFGNYYKPPGVPFIAIYDKNKALKGVLMGNVGVSSIKTVAFQ